MNIENKKTALDDDSLLYQKRDDSFGKKDTSAMTGKEKAGYFKDYYLKTVLIVLAVAAVLGSVLYSMLFNHQESILGIAFIDDACISETEAFNEHLREFFELTDEGDYIDTTNYVLSEYGSQVRFTTLASAGSLDIIFGSEDCFKQYSQMGYFADLSEILPAELYEKIKDRIVMSSEVETDENGDITQTLPEAPYGIDISQNALYKEYGGSDGKVIIGIVANTKQTENAVRLIEHLFSYEHE